MTQTAIERQSSSTSDASGSRQGEIGQLLGGIAHSGVSRLRSRLKQRIDRGQDARQRYERTEQKLQDSMSRLDPDPPPLRRHPATQVLTFAVSSGIANSR